MKRILAITFPTSPSPVGVKLSTEQLLALGTIHAGLSMNRLLGTDWEQHAATNVIAGLVTTLHTILPPEQFRAVMVQWEVDAIQLSEYLHLAGSSATTGNQPETKIIEA